MTMRALAVTCPLCGGDVEVTVEWSDATHVVQWRGLHQCAATVEEDR